MVHRSKKKQHEHEPATPPATPPAKSPVAKAEAASRGIAKKPPRARRAPEPKEATARKGKRRGLVRWLAMQARKTATRVARKATARVTARPRLALSRARDRVAARVARVRSMLAIEK